MKIIIRLLFLDSHRKIIRNVIHIFYYLFIIKFLLTRIEKDLQSTFYIIKI